MYPLPAFSRSPRHQFADAADEPVVEQSPLGKRQLDIALSGAELQQRLHQIQAVLVHLHRLGNTTLSIDEIGPLPIPLVWTSHDWYAYCIAEYYTSPPLPGKTASNDERSAAD